LAISRVFHLLFFRRLIVSPRCGLPYFKFSR
jgi:hypothetical protein